MNIFGVFRVKNHDFTQKNHIFSNFRGGGARRVRPPLDPPLKRSNIFRLKIYQQSTQLIGNSDMIFNFRFNPKSMHSILPRRIERLLSISHTFTTRFQFFTEFQENIFGFLWENIIVLSSAYSTSLQFEFIILDISLA